MDRDDGHKFNEAKSIHTSIIDATVCLIFFHIEEHMNKRQELIFTFDYISSFLINL